MMIRKSILFLCLLFSLTILAQQKTIVFSPQWNPNAQFAGYIAARELGYYGDEGLNVTFRYPEANKSSLDLLREGKADLVTNTLTFAIVSKVNEGLDLVNVLQTSQHTALCLALKRPKDKLDIGSLHGLRVGVWYNRVSIAVEAMNYDHHLNWTIVPFRRGFKLLSYGVLDAITVMEYNELLRLKYNGYDVSDHSVLRLCEHGYDIPEDGVYCMNDYYQQNADEVKAFVRATKKGWEWCRKHPEEATKYVLQEMRNEHVDNSEVIQRAGLKVILKKQEQTPDKASYSLGSGQFNQAVKILKTAGLINTNPDYKTFIAR
ncbi:MAG: ABC transporter substrate-binding protein [Prevotella sp.]|nr:ABC transporter substrate-binding protein [Prevotella sp.]